VNIIPSTVVVAGDTFSSMVSQESSSLYRIHAYRNGQRIRYFGGIIDEADIFWGTLIPVGFVLVENDSPNVHWELSHVHLFRDIRGGVQLVFTRVFHWGSAAYSLIGENVMHFSSRDVATGHLASPNRMICENETWLAIRDAAEITVENDYEIFLWYPSNTNNLLNATVTDVVIPHDDNITRRTGIVRYASPIDSSQDFNAMFVYDDEYFFQSAYEYNPSLATMSLLFQLSAWGSNDVTDYSEKMINARNLFKDLDFVGFEHNFTDIVNNGIVGQPTKDSIGAVAAHRVITQNDEETGNSREYTLIALAIRGGGYESEWASNFTIGRSGHHHGFYQSSEIVAQFLRDYINNQDITGDIKLWLTGFSRAGAVANILAGGINSGRILLPNSVTLRSHNFFTYTFATPAGVLQHSSIDFENIFNIILPSDPVPMVAPIYWDFVRYGDDRQLPSSATVAPFIYDIARPIMLQQFYSLESVVMSNASYLLDDFTMMRIAINAGAIIPGGNPFISIQDDVRNPQPQSVFIFDYVHLLASNFIQTRDNFVNTYQDAIRTTAGLFFSATPQQTEIFVESLMSNLTSVSSWGWILYDLLRPIGGITNALTRIGLYISRALVDAGIPHTRQDIYDASVAFGSLILRIGARHPNRATTLIMNLETIGQAHYPEIYLAWLMSMDPNFREGVAYVLTTGHFRIIRINCPVDVRVYLNNQLVAAITDDIPQNISSIVAAVNEDGEKLVFLPATEEYRIELSSTDDSSMTFSVHEFNPHAGAINRILNYYDIPISTGQRLYAHIGAFSAFDLADRSMAPSSTVYTLETGGVSILPCENLTGSQAINAFYDVNAVPEDSSQGIVLGSGIRLRGTYAIVTAFPFYGYEFLGWYLDNTVFVSDNAEYRFRVMNDTNLTARFIVSDCDEPVAVEGISIESGDITILAGSALYLVANIIPTNATNRNVSWHSENLEIATVDVNGLVRAIAPGTVIISVTAQDGGHTDWVVVTVVPRLQSDSVLPLQVPSASQTVRNMDLSAPWEGTATVHIDADNITLGALNQDISADMYLAWYGDYLYFRADILEPSPMMNNAALIGDMESIWDGDSIELFFGPDNVEYDGNMQINDVQLLFGVHHIDAYYEYPYTIYSWYNSGIIFSPPAADDVVSIDITAMLWDCGTGYSLAARIPLNKILGYTPSQDRYIRFDMGMNTALYPGGERTHQQMWHGYYNNAASRDNWGMIKLVDVIKHVVNFYDNDIQIDSQTVEHGNTIIRPEDPTKENYRFDGWFTNPKGTGIEWDFAIDIVTENITLYAIWYFIGAGPDPVTFTITFDLGYEGAVGVPSTQIINENAIATEPEPPVRECYIFVEWQLEGVVFCFDTLVTKDIMLVAAWIANEDCDCDDCNELPPSCLGDVNRDGNVDIEDMLLILQYINDEITANNLCIVAADLDHSGTIDFIDLMFTEFMIMGFFSPQDLGCTCHDCNNPTNDDSARSFAPAAASGFQTLLGQGALNNFGMRQTKRFMFL